jgi:hypothetical protein
MGGSTGRVAGQYSQGGANACPARHVRPVGASGRGRTESVTAPVTVSAAAQAREEAAGALAVARVGGHPPALFGEALALGAGEECADSLEKSH